jgi:hypothetical protein
MSKCKVRKDLAEQGLSVSIGNNNWLEPKKEVNYKWGEDDLDFYVFVDEKWQDAASIDFDFID